MSKFNGGEVITKAGTKAKQAIQQLLNDELIGADRQQPIEYYDEVEKDNVRKYPTQEMLIENALKAEYRLKLDQLFNKGEK